MQMAKSSPAQSLLELKRAEYTKVCKRQSLLKRISKADMFELLPTQQRN